MFKAFIKNATFNTISQIVMILLNFLVVPFYISRLSVAGYGVYSFINGFLGYFAVMQMGLGPAVIKFTAQYHVEKKHKEINRLITLATIIQLCIGGLVALLICTFSSQVLTFILKDRIDYLAEGKSALSLASINFILDFTGLIYFSALKGFQRYDISAQITIFRSICSIFLSVLLVWLGYGIIGIILAWLIVNSMVFVFLHFAIRSVCREFAYDFRMTVLQIKEIYSFGFFVFIGRLNRLGINALPTLLIGHYIGPAGIAYYDVVKKIFSYLNNFLSEIITVLFPMVSELKAANKIENISSIYQRANKYLSIVSTPLYCFLGIFAWEILNMWVGGEIADNAHYLMMLLCFAFYLSSASMVPANFILGLGHSRLVALNATAQLVTIAISLPLLLGKYKLIGAGFGFILFELVAVLNITYITCHIVKVSPIHFWFVDRGSPLLLGLSSFGLPYCLFQWYMPQIYKMHLFATISSSFLFGIIIYFSFAMFYGIIEEEFKEKILSLIRRA